MPSIKITPQKPTINVCQDQNLKIYSDSMEKSADLRLTVQIYNRIKILDEFDLGTECKLSLCASYTQYIEAAQRTRELWI